MGQLMTSQVNFCQSGAIQGSVWEYEVSTVPSGTLWTSIKTNLSVSKPHFVLQISQIVNRDLINKLISPEPKVGFTSNQAVNLSLSVV